MLLLTDMEFYSTAFNDFNYSNRKYLDILFNNNNQFVLNKNLIDYIEDKIHPDNIEYFNSFVKELIDQDRIENSNNISPIDYLETTIKYYTSSNKEFLIPIKSSDVSGFRKDVFHNKSEEHTLNSSHVKISYAVFCLK